MKSTPEHNKKQLFGIITIIAVICFSVTGGAYHLIRTRQHTENNQKDAAETLNRQLYQACLYIDFKTADSLYHEIHKVTRNQIELLISEIHMMSMCQRTAQNLLYFDYHNRAKERIERIEEESLLNESAESRYIYAINKYRLVNTLNLLQLSAVEYAERELSHIEVSDDLRNDKNLWTNYNYLKGLVCLNKSETSIEQAINAFDYLFQAYAIAERNNMVYFKSIIEQVFAEMLTNEYTDSIIHSHRQNEAHYLYNFFVPHDSIEKSISTHLHIAKSMALKSIDNATALNNLILKANGLLALGDTYFYNEEYLDALECYGEALEQLNQHHLTFYNDSANRLLVIYDEHLSPSVDMEWTKDENVQTVPATLLHIREALSRVHSALNEKQVSDYNRNIYLDLLSHTKQERFTESRINDIDAENKSLKILLCSLLATALIITTLLLLYAIKWRKRNKLQAQLFCDTASCFTQSTLTDTTEKLSHISESTTAHLSEKNRLSEFIQSFINWRERNVKDKDNTELEITELYEKYKSSHLQIEKNKRTNITKRAKVSLIHSIVPFIDRILFVAKRITQNNCKDDSQLTYICELADQISNYNNVLSDWVQIKEGKIDLTIENFRLQELFDIISKSVYSYKRKKINFEIKTTELSVKADKALTFFMLNTLAENARKFTPEGGTVTIDATELDDSIEIAVTDTGLGLTDEEQKMILTSRVYDSKSIGAGVSNIQKEKGSGFGLLNCKGIIEKYRKSGSIFSVCQFNIESVREKGSRFSFRLPKGVTKIATALIVGIMMSFSGNELFAIDSTAISNNHIESSESGNNRNNLDSAVCYADSVYFSNLNGDYEKAIQFAGLSLKHITRHYLPVLPENIGNKSLTVKGNGKEELEWWAANVDADYSFIINLRNEIAIAALALQQWNVYEYNNHQFTILSKALTDDDLMINTFQAKRTEQNHLTIAIMLLIFTFFITILIIYIVYLRKDISFRFNFMKVLEISRAIQTATEQDQKLEIILNTVVQGLSEIHELTGAKFAIRINKEEEKRMFVYTPLDTQTINDGLLQKSYENNVILYDHSTNTRIFPMCIETKDKVECIGAVGLSFGAYQVDENDLIFEQFIINHLTIILKETFIRKKTEENQLGEINDRQQRALFEANRLYVQNQILENCLSTIKHESIYYPARIKQIVKSIESERPSDNNCEIVHSLVELVEYYKEIYSLLSLQADKQIDTGLYKSTHISSSEICKYWSESARKVISKNNLSTTVKLREYEKITVCADSTLLHLILEDMANVFLNQTNSINSNDNVTLKLEEFNERFVKFSFHCTSMLYEKSEITDIFQPRQGGYHFLLWKEIIREHDKLNKFCGCRINIDMNEEAGTTLWFTLPINQ